MGNQLTVPTDELYEYYLTCNSVWKTGEHFGLAGQTVHERLKRYNKKLKGENFSSEEDKLIIEAYKKSKGIRDLNLPELTKKLGRDHHTNVSRRARALGLTSPVRSHTPEQGLAQAKRQVSSMQKGILTRSYENINKGWYEFSDDKRYYLKSGWEIKYANYLESLLKLKAIKSWEYEPDTFWFLNIKRGVRSYTPDFKIVANDDTEQYHEVKGWLDDRSKTKIKRMRIYYPKVKISLIMKKELKTLGLI